MAFFGQIAMQGGSSHCWHVEGTKKVGFSDPLAGRLCRTPILFRAIFRVPVCFAAHAVSHSLQPSHLMGSI